MLIFGKEVQYPLKSVEKTCYKMIFRPEHAEDISSVYLLNQKSLFQTYLQKKYQKWYDPYLCNCLYVHIYLYIFLFYR